MCGRLVMWRKPKSCTLECLFPILFKFDTPSCSNSSSFSERRIWINLSSMAAQKMRNWTYALGTRPGGGNSTNLYFHWPKNMSLTRWEKKRWHQTIHKINQVFVPNNSVPSSCRSSILLNPLTPASVVLLLNSNDLSCRRCSSAACRAFCLRDLTDLNNKNNRTILQSKQFNWTLLLPAVHHKFAQDFY